MKKVIQFTKIRYIMIAISLVLIISLNLTTIFVHKGLNFGIDFVGGMTTQIQIAPVAFQMRYAGEGKADVLIGGDVLTLKVTKTDAEADYSYNFALYDSITALAADMQKVEGLKVDILKYGSAKPDGIISINYPVTLTAAQDSVFNANIKLPDPKDIAVTRADIVSMLKPFGNTSVQNIGVAANQEFFVKIQQGDLEKQFASSVKTSETDATAETDAKNLVDNAEKKVIELLTAKYERQTILIKATDFVGPSFSKELLQGAILAVIIAVALILIYVSFRFKFEFGVGGVVALIHDLLIMVGVIGALQLEWNSTTIAAMLTILGYSINDTIVVYDRIRENMTLMKDVDIETVINTSITQSISRTINTSLTTVLAIVPIYFFASGTIKDFAFNLIVGIVSGTYSSIYIAAPIVLAWRARLVKNKLDKAEAASGKKHTDAPVKIVAGAEQITTTVQNSREAGSEARGTIVREQVKKQKKRKR